MPEAPDSSRAVLDALAAGCVRTCARLISRIERGEHGLDTLLPALYRAGGRARVIGVTGPPGAGKSSLVGRLAGVWRRRGLTVAVLAVDPSSPFSGGAVLGDRLRMVEHAADDGVFIRSMAARGRLGGLARAAGDALTVLEAMPWDVVVAETVGTGQSETDIMRHAEAVILVHTPMGGDDVQAAKAGINEIADVHVVNKRDHPGAERTRRHIRDMLALAPPRGAAAGWVPPVVMTQSLTGDGAEDLADRLDDWFRHLDAHSGVARERRRERVRHRSAEIARDLVERRLHRTDGTGPDALTDDVVDRRSDPYALARRLIGDGP